jgi:hypothetical protein
LWTAKLFFWAARLIIWAAKFIEKAAKFRNGQQLFLLLSFTEKNILRPNFI